MTLSRKTIVALTFFVAIVSLAVAFSAHGQVTVCEKEPCSIGNPLSGVSTIPDLICKVVVILAKNLMPPIVVIMILWASFLFLTAAGQPGKIVQARTTLVWAIIGTVILLLSVPLVNLVATAIGGTTPTQCAGTGATSSIYDIAAALINWFAWLLGMLSVVMGLYAGFLYMTSRGEPQKVSTAGRVIFYAVVGILVAIIAFSLVSIINTFISPATTVSTSTTTSASTIPFIPTTTTTTSSMPSSCAATTILGCRLLASSSGSQSGACSSGYLGACTYDCNSGVWTMTQNDCVLSSSTTTTTTTSVPPITTGVVDISTGMPNPCPVNFPFAVISIMACCNSLTPASFSIGCSLGIGIKCPTGYLPDAALNTCVQCLSGYTFNATSGMCEL